eukprot:7388299-Prymnesium_polylepis.1
MASAGGVVELEEADDDDDDAYWDDWDNDSSQCAWSGDESGEEFYDEEDDDNCDEYDDCSIQAELDGASECLDRLTSHHCFLLPASCTLLTTHRATRASATRRSQSEPDDDVIN